VAAKKLGLWWACEVQKRNLATKLMIAIHSPTQFKRHSQNWLAILNTLKVIPYKRKECLACSPIGMGSAGRLFLYNLTFKWAISMTNSAD
jgi:hypothetical protein